MVQQLINIGTTANDGTGDELRDAFNKVNGNDTELYGLLDLKAALVSPSFTGTPTVPTAAPGTNTTQIASTAFVAALVSLATTGLLDLKGDIDCSANPNYPAASKGDAYIVSVAGKIGGGSGINVDVGDTVIAKLDNAGGAQAAVGSSWWAQEHNLAGALTSSDIGSTVQAYNTRLAELAAIVASNDSVIQRKGGVWVERTLAQLYADFALIVPAFRASLSAKLNDVTGDGTVYTIPWNTETDQAGNFNTSTGKFTAPVTGYYHFSTNVMLQDASFTAFTKAELTLIAGSVTYYLYYNGDTAGFTNGTNIYQTLSGSTTIKLTAGQTAEIAVSVSGSTKTIDVAQSVFSQFSGHLIS